MKISMFPGKIGIGFANRVSQTFESKLNGVNRLVVDLRGNPGGGVGGLRVMSYFTPSKQPVGYSLDRPTAERGYDKDSLPRFDRIPSSKLGIPLLALRYAAKKSVVLVTEGLGSKPFHGKIVLLVNEHSTGAAEMVAHFAQENGLATIVGTKTPGHLVAREAFDVGGGYKLTVPIGAYVSWAGTRIEGRGIEPDVPVDWSYNDALAGVDTQLNKGIEWRSRCSLKRECSRRLQIYFRASMCIGEAASRADRSGGDERERRRAQLAEVLRRRFRSRLAQRVEGALHAVEIECHRSGACENQSAVGGGHAHLGEARPS